MTFDKVFLIGNGRVADDCLRIMAKRNIQAELIEIFEEKFKFSRKLCERLGVSYRHVDKKEVGSYLLGITEKVLIISAHNSYIFPQKICEKENLTIINLHIAYLPEYRGMNPPTWTIYNQEQYAGVTWHTVSSKIDNGGIIVRSKVDIDPDDTAMKLMMKCFKQGIVLFEEYLDSFLNETYSTFIPQNPNTHLYLAKELPNDGMLDNSWNFEKTYAFLRSMDYSGSNLMRLPRVEKKGKIFEITRYQKTVEDNSVANRTEYWGDGLLKINWGGVRLKLHTA